MNDDNDQQPAQQASGTAADPNTPQHPKLAVIDIKTTGFSTEDRVAEFACVTVADGEIVDEYDTLVQPGVHAASLHHHGITPEMLKTAPDFQTIAADVAARLNDAVLVAHNLPFQQRMLQQEINRLGQGVAFSHGQGICTYMLTRQKISSSSINGATTSPDHTAKGDALTVASLLTAYKTNIPNFTLKAASFIVHEPPSGITAQRVSTPTHGTLQEIADHTAWPGTTEPSQILYLEALDYCLDDLVLDAAETAWLDTTATALDISDTVREDLHERYFTLLSEEIESDGVVTQDERDLAVQVAGVLGITF